MIVIGKDSIRFQHYMYSPSFVSPQMTIVCICGGTNDGKYGIYNPLTTFFLSIINIKIKHAIELLKLLDSNKLKHDFSELKRWIEKLPSF